MVKRAGEPPKHVVPFAFDLFPALTKHPPPIGVRIKGGSMVKMWKAWTIASAAIVMTASGPAAAQERSATRHDFAAAERDGACVIVYRPRVKVGEQSTGGDFEPRADWNDQARTYLGGALDAAQRRIGNIVVDPPEMTADEARQLSDYQSLFEAVANSIIDYQFFVGNRLETKKREQREDIFDWSLGRGVRDLPGAGGANYALFINTNDQYGSTGRKIFQALAAVSVGVGVKSGIHAGYAALVDLDTGNIVWINADYAMGGDVRTPEGAEKRMTQLLEDFPLGPRVE